MMKNNTLTISFILLVLLNLCVLYLYNGKKSDLLDLRSKSAINDYRSNSYSISNKIINNPEFIDQYIAQLPVNILNNEILVVLFTTNRDCTNCITDTIQGLYTIDNNISDRLHLYYQEISNESYKFESFFNYHSYNYSNNSLSFVDDFKDKSIDQFPIFVIFDNNRKVVLEAFQPEPGNIEALSAFINSAKLFVNSDF